uniref:Leucine-rich repeat-containing protein 51 n=1 Tax=Graphocephala atropunctata TaxID=36148 RepID=A0A1B6LBW3_9HEMI
MAGTVSPTKQKVVKSTGKLSGKTLSLKPPLDFSFKKLISEDDIVTKKPRKNRVGRLPDVGANNKYVTASVWLSHNKIQTTRGAAAILNHIIAPSQLSWLDLSFNQLYDIDEQILLLKNLKILYLHGNNIQNVSSISILKDLPELRTLTLHGNPIDSISQYRTHVIYMLPKLSNLDFSPVVGFERKGVLPPGFLDFAKFDKKKATTKA